MILRHIHIIICTVVLFATGINLSFGNLTKEQIDGLQELLYCENVDDFCKKAISILQMKTGRLFLKKIRKEIATAEQKQKPDLVTLLKKIKYKYQKGTTDPSLIKCCKKCGTFYAKTEEGHHECQKKKFRFMVPCL